MDDELLAQPQVMKLLDSLREQYTRYQEVCRQRSKRTQLEEIQQKVMQVSSELFLNAPRVALSSSSRLCFLQTKNRRGDLHASRHSTNVSVLVLLSASHCGCHSDFPKAILICGGCSKCALLPWGCPCAAHCHSAWLCCWGANACPAGKERNSHKWDTFDWGVSFAWELKTFPCPCHLKFLLLKISHYLFLCLCNAGGFNLS